MYDIHSHVLFDIDDGAKSLDDAVGLCRMAHEDGVKAIVATPHIRPSVWPNDRERIESRLEDLRDELGRCELPIEVVLGAEVYFDSGIVEAVKDGAYPSYADRRRYVLFELPNYFLMRQVQETVFEFRTAGLTPVLAHPERNSQVMKDLGAIEDLVRMGTVLQVTAMSITGKFGRQPKKAAELLLDHGLAHVVASDAHSQKYRPARLKEAFATVTRRCGPERAQTLFVDNPRAIIAGGEVETSRDEHRREGGLRRLLKRFL